MIEGQPRPGPFGSCRDRPARRPSRRVACARRPAAGCDRRGQRQRWRRSHRRPAASTAAPGWHARACTRRSLHAPLAVLGRRGGMQGRARPPPPWRARCASRPEATTNRAASRQASRWAAQPRSTNDTLEEFRASGLAHLLAVSGRQRRAARRRHPRARLGRGRAAVAGARLRDPGGRRLRGDRRRRAVGRARRRHRRARRRSRGWPARRATRGICSRSRRRPCSRSIRGRSSGRAFSSRSSRSRPFTASRRPSAAGSRARSCPLRLCSPLAISLACTARDGAGRARAFRPHVARRRACPRTCSRCRRSRRCCGSRSPHASLWPVAPGAAVVCDWPVRALGAYIGLVARLGAWLDGALPGRALLVALRGRRARAGSSAGGRRRRSRARSQDCCSRSHGRPRERRPRRRARSASRSSTSDRATPR